MRRLIRAVSRRKNPSERRFTYRKQNAIYCIEVMLLRKVIATGQMTKHLFRIFLFLLV